MISVVIPTLNEVEALPRLLTTLTKESVSQEVIVVDGGSSDNTARIARENGVQLIHAERGRGQQLFAGIMQASGEIVLFLHADCQFPPGGLVAIHQAMLTNPDRIGGNFQLFFDGDDKFSRWLEKFYRLIRSNGIYYGDSAIFIRRQALEDLGGLRRSR